MVGVNNGRHCSNAGCGTSVCRIPCIEMPWLLFHTFLLHCPPPVRYITRRDYTFLVNHLCCALGFLSARIAFLGDAPTSVCRRFQSIFSKYLSDKRKNWQSKNVSIFICHLRPVISIVGKYLKHFNNQCEAPFIGLRFSSTYFCYRKVSLKQLLFSHNMRNISLREICHRLHSRIPK